jgi:hypothetical protein
MCDENSLFTNIVIFTGILLCIGGGFSILMAIISAVVGDSESSSIPGWKKINTIGTVSGVLVFVLGLSLTSF